MPTSTELVVQIDRGRRARHRRPDRTSAPPAAWPSSVPRTSAGSGCGPGVRRRVLVRCPGRPLADADDAARFARSAAGRSATAACAVSVARRRRCRRRWLRSPTPDGPPSTDTPVALRMPSIMSAFFVLVLVFTDSAWAMAWSSSRSLPSNTERSSCCSAVIGILVSNVLVGRWIDSSCQDSGVGICMRRDRLSPANSPRRRLRAGRVVRSEPEGPAHKPERASCGKRRCTHTTGSGAAPATTRPSARPLRPPGGALGAATDRTASRRAYSDSSSSTAPRSASTTVGTEIWLMAMSGSFSP